MKFRSGLSFTETLSVLGIIALLTSAGAHMLVNIIGEGVNTACYVTTRNIERAEQLYYLTNNKHSTEYIPSGHVNKNSVLVKAGYLEMSDNDVYNCSYIWVSSHDDNKHIMCLHCNDLKPNSAEILELLEKYAQQKPLSDSEYVKLIAYEYKYIEDYLSKTGQNFIFR